MQPFRVVQYNVLGRSFSLAKYFPYAGHYICEGREDLNWDTRSRRLRQTVEQLEGDIYCFCEVDEKENFHLQFTHDYVYQPRPRRPDGCMVMWRRERFSLVHSCHVEFPRTDRIALAVQLRHLESGRDIRVISTHLFWDKTSDLQLQEARVLTDFIAASKIPTILAGDLNNSRDSEIFKTVVSGSHLLDAFTLAESSPPAFTSLVPGPNGRKEEIDFILADSAAFRAGRAGVFDAGSVHEGIPNAAHGSDHLPVFADLILSPNRL